MKQIREALEKVNLARRLSGGRARNEDDLVHERLIGRLLFDAMVNLDEAMAQMERGLTREMIELEETLSMGFRMNRPRDVETI